MTPFIVLCIMQNIENGNSLLIVCAQNNLKKMARLLVREAGAELDAQNKRGHTALHYAFAFGFLDFAQMLLTLGASDKVQNDAGLTCYQGMKG